MLRVIGCPRVEVEVEADDEAGEAGRGLALAAAVQDAEGWKCAYWEGATAWYAGGGVSGVGANGSASVGTSVSSSFPNKVDVDVEADARGTSFAAFASRSLANRAFLSFLLSFFSPFSPSPSTASAACPLPLPPATSPSAPSAASSPSISPSSSSPTPAPAPTPSTRYHHTRIKSARGRPFIGFFPPSFAFAFLPPGAAPSPNLGLPHALRATSAVANSTSAFPDGGSTAKYTGTAPPVAPLLHARIKSRERCVFGSCSITSVRAGFG
ncbi:hypothetical protein C8R46DRAFT_1059953, partial [Mycena filopes]